MRCIKKMPYRRPEWRKSAPGFTRGDWAIDAAETYLIEIHKELMGPDLPRDVGWFYGPPEREAIKASALETVVVPKDLLEKLTKRAACSESLFAACRDLLDLAQNRDLARLDVLDHFDPQDAR